MRKMFIKYNPFKVETTFKWNENDISNDSRLFAFKNERLQLWVSELFKIIQDEFNEDTLEVEFYGTSLDFEDLKYYAELANKNGMKIHCKHIESKDVNEKINGLIQLFEEMQLGPFEDLKEQNIINNFNKALGTEFEVNVIATMSSGKSTLINSFIGKPLMPSKQQACTATIVSIKDVDGKKQFSGVAKDKEGNVIEQTVNADLNTLKKWNDSEAVSFVDLEGEIPSIHSETTQLVLVDTPGPNNSQNEEHRNQTHRVIKNSSKPIVLYVLNGHQLGTDDDKLLLNSVANAMKVGGKQSKDRFIFVVNKVDDFDVEEDPIESVLENVKKYLEKNGIKNPNIFLVSAEVAKLIRFKQNSHSIPPMKDSFLSSKISYFQMEEQMHLQNYAPISAVGKDKINQRLKLAQQSNDACEQCLVYSGVPAVEEAINEYLNKYAYTAKIKNAVDTFKKKVEEKQIMDNLLKGLQTNEEQKKYLLQKVNRVKEQLADGQTVKAFRQRIQNLEPSKEKLEEIRKIRAKTNVLQEFKLPEKLTALQAQQECMKLIKRIQHIQSDVVTELEKILEQSIRDDANQLLAEYVSYIQNLLKDSSISVGNFELNSTREILLSEIPSAQTLIDKHKYSERVKVGEEKVRNENWKWYNPISWFTEDKWYNVGVYENRDFVNGDQIYTDMIEPVITDIQDNIRRAQNHMQEESTQLKNFFIDELDRLDQVIKKKLNELSTLMESNKVLEEKIKEDTSKMRWIENLLVKLDQILEI